MSTFIRILPRPDQKMSPGKRLALWRNREEGELTQLNDETTLPEKVNRTDARHITIQDSVILTDVEVRWLHSALGELIAEMDEALTLSFPPCGAER